MGFLDKIGIAKLVVSEEDIIEMTKAILSQPWTDDLPNGGRLGVKFGLSAVLRHMVDKNVISEPTRNQAMEMIEEWYTSA